MLNHKIIMWIDRLNQAQNIFIYSFVKAGSVYRLETVTKSTHSVLLETNKLNEVLLYVVAVYDTVNAFNRVKTYGV